LSQAESDVANLRGKLEIREGDIEKLEKMLRRLENESNQINQSQSHDKISLELEIERIQRDLLNSNQESHAFKEQNLALKNQIAKFQAAASALVRILFLSSFRFLPFLLSIITLMYLSSCICAALLMD
jgi:ABC-type Na+ efflux pump permease subunit